MGRKKNQFRPHKLPLTLNEPAHDRLEMLVKTGGYGNNPTEAAKIIIMRHLQELDAAQKINLFDGAAVRVDSDKQT